MTRHPRSHTAAGPSRWAATALVTATVALAAALATGAAEKAEKKVAHIPGSRFTYVHTLALKDAEGTDIALDEPPVMPFSYDATCSKCHEYDTIRKGWHFNAPDPDVPPGRPGQPWFWADQVTGTQIPVSYRDWPNTWHPDELGITPWQFIQMFGHHLPGGGPGEMTKVEDPAARWLVSGTMQINCGSCHSGDPAYDQVESFLQIARQNFRWAATAATPLAVVTGAAAAMPAFYDPVMPPEDEKTAAQAPTVQYDADRFDPLGRVTFDLPSQPPDKRCYFCHSHTQTSTEDYEAPEAWKTDVDVHMDAGLTCTDCHRHGLDHQVTRNYPGEDLIEGKPRLATLTCRGCHMGAESADAGPFTHGSRLGAPVPTHVGLPTIHLEKLACTTCHSGPYPGERTTRVQTSMAHSLEFQGKHRGRHALPFIVEPVFAHREYDGTIGPQRMVWPAFWTRLVTPEPAAAPETEPAEAAEETTESAEGAPTETAETAETETVAAGPELKPMGPAEVYGMAEDAFKAEYAAETTGSETADEEAPAETAQAEDAATEGDAAEEADDADPAETPAAETDDAATAEGGDEPAEDEEEVAEDEIPGLTAPKPDLPPAKVKAVLAALAKAEEGTTFGYVCSGKLYTLADDGSLVTADHAQAEPVAWPIGHNVRPAEYALGAGSGNAACTVCHGFDAAIVWGKVEKAAPAKLGDEDTTPMYAFQGRDLLTEKAWAMSYIFRPIFKPVGFATAAVIAAVLLAYLVRGIAALARWAADTSPAGPATK